MKKQKDNTSVKERQYKLKKWKEKTDLGGLLGLGSER